MSPRPSPSIEKLFGSRDRSYFSRFDHRKKNPWRKFFGGLFFLTLIFGVGLFLSAVFFGADRGAYRFGERVNIKIDAPRSIQPGAEAPIVLEIFNKENREITSARLNIKPPQGVFLVSSVPESEGQAIVEWDLGVLKPRHSSAIKTVWRFEGGEGEQKALNFSLNYNLTGFSLVLTKQEKLEVNLGEPSLRLTWEGQDKALSGDTVKVNLKYENTTDEEKFKVRLDLAAPEEISAVEYDPSPRRLGSWEFEKLSPRESGEIKLSFRVPDGEAPLIFSASIGTTSGGNVYYQQKADYTLDRSTPASGFSLEVGEFKNSVPFALILANRQTASLKDVLFELTVTSNGFLLDNLTFEKNPKTEERMSQDILTRVFTWSGNDLPGGGSVEPEQEIRLSGSMPLSSVFVSPTKGKPENVFVEFRGRMTALVDRDGSRVTVAKETAPIRHNFSNAVKATISEENSGKIILQIQNGANRIENIEFFAALADDAVWNGSQEVGAGTIVYDPSSRFVRWKINWLPAYMGANESLKASFVVQKNNGQVLSHWEFKAKDSFTGEEIKITK